jgi:hypothetical protein
MYRPAYNVAFNHLASSNKLLARPYVHLLKTINPEARLSGDLKLSYVEKTLARLTSTPLPTPAMINASFG